jgi:outer membrane protein assembly factor BamD (BamD/ComL family)
MNDFNEGRFKESIETFQKIKDRYPYSTFAITAELKMADALYERGSTMKPAMNTLSLKKCTPEIKMSLM